MVTAQAHLLVELPERESCASVAVDVFLPRVSVFWATGACMFFMVFLSVLAVQISPFSLLFRVSVQGLSDFCRYPF